MIFLFNIFSFHWIHCFYFKFSYFKCLFLSLFLLFCCREFFISFEWINCQILFFRFQIITNQSISFYFNLNFYSNNSKFPFLFFEYLKNSQLVIFISSYPQTTLFEESATKNDNWQIIISMGYKNWFCWCYPQYSH